jgi:hypothetical protein
MKSPEEMILSPKNLLMSPDGRRIDVLLVNPFFFREIRPWCSLPLFK